MRMRITNVNGHTTIENIESNREIITRRLLEIRQMRKDSEERAKYRKAWHGACEFDERNRVREILEREG